MEKNALPRPPPLCNPSRNIGRAAQTSCTLAGQRGALTPHGLGERGVMFWGTFVGSGHAQCFSQRSWGNLTLDVQVESGHYVCGFWAGLSSKCLGVGTELGVLLKALRQTLNQLSPYPSWDRLLHSVPPFPVLFPHRNSPSDLAFNGDLAQLASSEPCTDVSYPPVRN